MALSDPPSPDAGTAEAPPPRVAIVTGAASGIGAAVSRRFARNNIRPVMLDLDASVVESAAEIGGLGLVGDVSDPALADAAVAAAMDKFGRLDILVNNAGVGRARSLFDTDDETMDRMVGVNLVSVLRMTRTVAPHLTRPGGRIVSISSTLGLAGYPGTTVYGATKAAIAQMTRELAAELGREGVLVNAVAPGAIYTPMTRQRIDTDANYQRAFITTAPLGRPGTADEIAGVVAFLTSEDAAYVTGQVIAVDGGWLAARHLPPETN